MAEDGIQIIGVYERSDAKERKKEGMQQVKAFIGPEFDTNVEITENGVKYLVDVKDGQKTGFLPGSEVQPTGYSADLQG